MAKIDLICGFLGAGKTTFLKRYLPFLQESGQRFVLIENEFGTAGVDSALLKNDVPEIKELSGGCICCSLKVGFHDTMLSLSQECSRILVEPSGVFDVDDFFDIMRGPALQGTCEVSSVILILDATTICTLDEFHLNLLHSSLLSAGAVYLSRWELLPDECARQAARAAAKALCPNALLIAKSGEDLSEQDFQMLSTSGYHIVEHERRRGDHSTLFQSTLLRPEATYTEEALLSACALLQQGEYGEVLRVKGFVSGTSGFFSLNFTPSATEIAAAAATLPMLNVIGTGLNRKKLKVLFK